MHTITCAYCGAAWDPTHTCSDNPKDEPQRPKPTLNRYCYRCRCWDSTIKPSGLGSGECRRRPPTLLPNSFIGDHGRWPITQSHHWCEDWLP